MKNILWGILFLALAIPVFGKNNEYNKSHSIKQEKLNENVLHFFENKGQIQDQFRKVRSDIDFNLPAQNDLNIFIGSGSIAYQFNRTQVDLLANGESVGHFKTTISKIDIYRLDLKLLGANQNAKIIVGAKDEYYEQYFSDWTEGKSIRVNSYSMITYKDIYPKIDWVLYIKDGHLKHEFILNKGANYKDIQISYEGAKSIQIDDKGNCVAKTPLGIIEEEAPICFDDKKRIVASKYTLNANILSYEIAPFSGILTIDPTLYWSTYYGNYSHDIGNSVSTDAAGNVYMGGKTQGNTNIATVGAHQVTLSGIEDDGYIAKFDRAGNRIWGTYYGGNGTDNVNDICNDPSGNVFVVGATISSAGIASASAHKTTMKGGDGFIAKFSASGTLIWGTYFGADSSDFLNSVVCDASGNLYACGLSSSTTGAATIGAYQTSCAGAADAILCKFNNSGILQWASYYGGSSAEHALSIDLDASANLYITGHTNSTSGIATTGAFKTTYSGAAGVLSDAFLAKFNSSGAIQWATYFGGSSAELGYGVATDAGTNVFICGRTTSSSGIATTGAHQTIYGGTEDAYLAKFNSSGIMQWSTYFGGNRQEAAYDLDIDENNEPIIVGSISSPGIAGTLNAYKRTLEGYQDAFITKFFADGDLDWSTYFGGPNGEEAQGIKINGINNVYVSGYTYSTSGITTPSAHQTSHGGGGDAFLAKFNFCVTSKKPAAIIGASSVCLGKTISMTNAVPGGVWSSTMPSVTSVNPITGVVTPIKTGIDTVLYTITDSCGTAVAGKIINVYPLIAPQICVASLDTMINKIQIVWEKSKYNNVDQFNIFKKDATGTFLKIASLPYSATSIYKDLSSSPNTESSSYKMTITDSCGNESLLSASTVHSTVYLTSSFGSGSSVNLNWNLYSGKAISKQFVLRSVAGAPFTSIASPGITATTYTDLTPPAGTVKYRILSVSSKCSPTGTAAYDSILSNVGNPNAANIVDQNQLNEVKFYPNPTQNTIYLEGLHQNCQLQLFTILGQLLLEEKSKSTNHQLSVSSLSNGVYLLKIIGTDGHIINKKIIKE